MSFPDWEYYLDPNTRAKNSAKIFRKKDEWNPDNMDRILEELQQVCREQDDNTEILIFLGILLFHFFHQYFNLFLILLLYNEFILCKISTVKFNIYDISSFC